ncbi:SDR family NAD(P)-dependent oxidoreductase [Hymenobacter terrenus]|uniref:SDR family NAD(P)-dependent oxidoreductase n=1 Tax=Hymenobacter terrenus TaxID=1629124 RepID=UPI000619C33B|nr:glucose 1-dehydrogenase [Hymenobacter terrenus]
MTSLTHKIALVTGASSGIGRATAVAMARAGATVVVAARRAAENEQTLAAVEAAGGQGFAHTADVTREAAVAGLLAEVLRRYGRLDCAFNNAGTIGSFAPLTEQTEEDFHRTFDVNVKGVWLCLKHEALAMRPAGRGAIVNCASWLSRGALVGSSVYSATKAAVEGLMRPAALELAPYGVRVNNVAPGGIATEMTREALGSDEAVQAFGRTHPVGRLGSPEEVARLVVWLCSDEATFVTGESILVDGGYTIPGQR